MSDFDSRARKAAGAVRRQIAETSPELEKGIRRAQRSTAARVAIPSAVAAAAVLIAGVAVALPRGGSGGTPSG
ncbi:MAG TPA: hypothetical protein VK754_05970, partial [Propionibacteriaceae bacterium]|nr:hypothetical protein [Propionibacteriaceae bacterium]